MFLNLQERRDINEQLTLKHTNSFVFMKVEVRRKKGFNFFTSLLHFSKTFSPRILMITVKCSTAWVISGLARMCMDHYLHLTRYLCTPEDHTHAGPGGGAKVCFNNMSNTREEDPEQVWWACSILNLFPVQRIFFLFDFLRLKSPLTYGRGLTPYWYSSITLIQVLRYLYVTEISITCVALAGKVQCAEMEWETFKAALLQQALWNTDSHKWKHLCGSLMNVGALKANKNGPNVNVNHLKIKLFPLSF